MLRRLPLNVISGVLLVVVYAVIIIAGTLT